jgi:hypothetical protein
MSTKGDIIIGAQHHFLALSTSRCWFFSKAKGSGIGNDKRFPSMEETSRTCALFAYDAHQQL